MCAFHEEGENFVLEFCRELPLDMDRSSSSQAHSLATHDEFQPFDQTNRDGFVGQRESLKIPHNLMTRPRALGLNVTQHEWRQTKHIDAH